jgi:hypothetical protein
MGYTKYHRGTFHFAFPLIFRSTYVGIQGCIRGQLAERGKDQLAITWIPFKIPIKCRSLYCPGTIIASDGMRRISCPMATEHTQMSYSSVITQTQKLFRVTLNHHTDSLEVAINKHTIFRCGYRCGYDSARIVVSYFAGVQLS